MVITFEVQIDPIRFQKVPHGMDWAPDPLVTFSPDQLLEMKELMDKFVHELDVFDQFTRSTMYVDGKQYQHG